MFVNSFNKQKSEELTDVQTIHSFKRPKKTAKSPRFSQVFNSTSEELTNAKQQTVHSFKRPEVLAKSPKLYKHQTVQNFKGPEVSAKSPKLFKNSKQTTQIKEETLRQTGATYCRIVTNTELCDMSIFRNEDEDEDDETGLQKSLHEGVSKSDLSSSFEKLSLNSSLCNCNKVENIGDTVDLEADKYDLRFTEENSV